MLNNVGAVRPRLRHRPAWMRRFELHPAGDRRLEGLWFAAQYGAGTLAIWGLLSRFRFPDWAFLDVAGHDVVLNIRWLDGIFWLLSARFFYRAMRGIALIGASWDWLEMEAAWAWIERNEPEVTA